MAQKGTTIEEAIAKFAQKGTTIEEAIAKFEAQGKGGHPVKAAEEKEVWLYGQDPPIEEMDASLSTLTCCENLNLSTNRIEKISHLNGLKNLKVLSLGNNYIKSLTGLEAVGDTLQELYISYNAIEKLKGINVLKRVKILYMSYNLVTDGNEFDKLADLRCLVELVFVGNPLEEKHTAEGYYRKMVALKLSKLIKLDGIPVKREEQDQ